MWKIVMSTGMGKSGLVLLLLLPLTESFGPLSTNPVSVLPHATLALRGQHTKKKSLLPRRVSSALHAAVLPRARTNAFLLRMQAKGEEGIPGTWCLTANIEVLFPLIAAAQYHPLSASADVVQKLKMLVIRIHV